ncbi:polyketide synthase dehydratase domain-containing protein [Streptomyces spectabilis]|uniref:Polyketide synthase dehydratase domain-containing protein n=1 Tax=Streptomyces spectabilis TaxID=68270 RepID=A0A7W8B4P7_STRST|nr:polyketide synthase dehydratase domain-containing protein [Streptomyces spectabilis]MBB5109671.1 hypothetical protein [Streptomyces spectabilis]
MLLGVERMRLHWRTPEGPLWSHARLWPADPSEVLADLTVFDGSSTVVAELNGIRGTRLGGPKESAA